MPKTNHNIVLDIDFTLVRTEVEGDPRSGFWDHKYKKLKLYSDPKRAHLRHRVYQIKIIDAGGERDPPGTGTELVLYGIYRPYLREFIDFCFKYFKHVIVWTAGTKKYAKEMCNILFPFQKPTLVYSEEETQFEIYEEEGMVTQYTRKSLRKLYTDPKLIDQGVNEKNTFILDDSDETFIFNKDNGILIPRYEANMTVRGIKEADESLLKLMKWLMKPEVRHSRDIRKLDKSEVFETEL